jgi:hypothetical protein
MIDVRGILGEEKRPQIPALRFASVGMTILFADQNIGSQTELSLREVVA